MTNTKVTKRALLASILALVMCFAMLLGSTYAWFTDSVTSANNKITSGTLDVELYKWTSATDSTKITNAQEPVFPNDVLWEPGHTQVVYLSIKNNGSLALKYKVALDVTQLSMEHLIDVMSYVITPDAKFGDVTEWAGNGTYIEKQGYNPTSANDVLLHPGEEHFFALSVHMDEEAGNEYQNQSVTFDIKVLATQVPYESDSFGDQYDKDATYSNTSASAPVPPAGEYAELEVRDGNMTKVASLLFPDGSIDPNASEIKVDVERKISEDRYDFDVTVEGLAENNTVPVKMQLRIPAGLDSSAIEVTHKDQPVNTFIYSPISGYVIIETTSFSPFAVEFDHTKLVDYTPADGAQIPVANVTDTSSTEANKKIEWVPVNVDSIIGPGSMIADPDNQMLDATFVFEAPHNSETIEACEYKDWACDFYVAIDKDIEAGSIVLGGNYGDFGWIGFTNPVAIEANQEIPLLGTVVVNDWTYAMIAGQVGSFACGVAENCVEGGTDLSGATFTVKLRLTKPRPDDAPEDYISEYYDVNVVSYTFD